MSHDEIRDPTSLDRLPIDPETGEALAPCAKPGYYPGFSTLAQQAFWDEATRAVVLDRVQNVPPIRFFQAELELAAAVFDRILPQDDRDAEHRIPILNYIDRRLYDAVGDGYRYAGVPSDAESYRLGFRGIEAIAQHHFEQPFVALGPQEQDRVILALREDPPPAGGEFWQQIPALHFFEMLVSDAVDAYYAHPYAWDEIGFGGPAYPRGYMRLEHGLAEPWEVAEQRYAWEVPPSSLSGEYQPIAGAHPERPSPSRGGTH